MDPVEKFRLQLLIMQMVAFLLGVLAGWGRSCRRDHAESD
jgi:hypothetical protein